MSYVASRRGGFVPVQPGRSEVVRRGGFGQGADERLSDGGRGRAEEAQVRDPGRLGGEAAADGRQASGDSRAQVNSQAPAGLAGQRGENWALPNARRNATGVTRPIRLACAHDRLVLLPDRGDRNTRPETIYLHGSLHQHVDSLVTKIWSIMDTWGLAVRGGYWVPVLNVEVAQGGERRFLELQAALRDSGLKIKRVSR